MGSSTYLLIPVHNRREITLQCLQSLYADTTVQGWSGLHILVIDDGSTDGTEAAIRTQFPTVEILKGDGNLWWTGAICQGMRHAFDQGGDFIFWLNDDCIPSSGSLARMLETSLEKENAIVGAACYLAESGALQPTGAQGRRRKAAMLGALVPVDEMSGHCVCIPRSVVEGVGFPDAIHFPHYHGDSSYILRATKAGFKAYLLGDAKVIHPGLIKARLEDFFDFKFPDFQASFNQIFLSKKSLYFIPTQLHYHLEKYGVAVGGLIFGMKMVGWMLRWVWLNLRAMVS